MKILFVSDFYSHSFTGGAENNDANLINYLESAGNTVDKRLSRNLVASELGEYDGIIVSNFTHLSNEAAVGLIKSQNYIIYEHDHKYVTTRDPSKFPNFNIPAANLVNKEFYEAAKCVVVLSNVCKNILEKIVE